MVHFKECTTDANHGIQSAKQEYAKQYGVDWHEEESTRHSGLKYFYFKVDLIDRDSWRMCGHAIICDKTDTMFE